MENYRETGDFLGKGSYGNVRNVIDSSGNYWALKDCQRYNSSMPAIIEGIIMSSIEHKNICNSKIIGADSEGTVIVMEKALGDAFIIKNPTVKYIKSFIFDCLCAIKTLHELRIIHGDVKTSNILCFPNGLHKITDFSLSLLDSNKDLKDLQVCTITFRPPECLLGENWDNKIDIWSLGCCVHDVFFGALPFPYQGDNRIKIDKKEEVFRTLDCIYDWAESRNQKIDWKKSGKPYLPYNRELEKCQDPKECIKDIIYDMLRIDKNKRPSASELLNNPLFSEFSQPDYYVKKLPRRKLPTPELIRVSRRFFNALGQNSRDIALDIYKLSNTKKFTEDELVEIISHIVKCITFVSTQEISRRVLDLEIKFMQDTDFLLL